MSNENETKISDAAGPLGTKSPAESPAPVPDLSAVDYQHYPHGGYPAEVVQLWPGIELRPDDRKRFDELVAIATPVRVHAEMMSDGLLWMSLEPVGQVAGDEERIVLWIEAKKGKLEIVTSVGD